MLYKVTVYFKSILLRRPLIVLPFNVYQLYCLNCVLVLRMHEYIVSKP